MSFSEQKKRIEDLETTISKQKLTESEELLLENEAINIERIKNACVEYIYGDLIEKEIKYSFKVSLGSGQYYSAKSEAELCIDLSLLSRSVLPKKVPDWTEHALKCFDHILIKYVSDGLNERVPNVGRVYETDLYNHFENKDDEQLKLIGSRFKSIYQLRSKFKHVQYTDEKGYRRIRKLSNKSLKKAKLVIIDFFKESLTTLLPLYKNVFRS